jgi:ATP-dependent protease ClpP protease subunit
VNLDLIRRQRALALANGETPPRAKAKQEASGTAKVFLDDVIDSWGFPFGISAKEFRQTLDEITADRIELHINSPGGEATEGVAMFTALRQHPANVTVYVDGLAASAASLVAMAGDEVVMSLGTTLMIHDAWALAMGNADDMADAATRLNTLSDSYAEIYAERTGRPIDEMRAVMRAEAWLNADQAIEQGFADRKDDRDGSADAAKAKALAEPGEPFKVVNVTINNPVAVKASSWLADAERLLSQTSPAEPVDGTTPTTTQEVAVADDAANTQGETGSEHESPPTIAPAASAAGPDLHAEIQRLSAQVAAANAREAARDKAEFFDTVLAQGRIAPAQRAEYEAIYDRAPEETKALLLNFAVGSAVPVASVGHEGEAETPMAEYEALYGKEN